jgi:transcriptional regulator with XRE-family HTH domain
MNDCDIGDAEQIRRVLAERLQQGLQRRGHTPAELHDAMAERGIPGNSLPAIYRYLRAEVAPSIQFLLATAEWLNIRPAWLITGEGAAATEDEGDPEVVERAIEEIRSVCPAVQFLSGGVIALVKAVWWRHSESYPKRMPLSIADGTLDDFLIERAHDIGQALQAPMNELRVESIVWEPGAIDTYVVSLCQALLAVLPKEGWKEAPEVALTGGEPNAAEE